jgi:peptide deformylase
MNTIILQPENPILRQQSQPITKAELRKSSVQNDIEYMLDFVYQRNEKGNKKQKTKPITVGLSANQIGLLKQISIVDLGIGKRIYSDIHVLINPEIIWHSTSTIERCEGCVNLPNIWGYIKRYKRIKIKAMDRSGNVMQLDLNGWPATLVQHEIDHLKGTLFIDHLQNPQHALLVEKKDYKKFKKDKKTWNKYIDVSHLIKHQ